MEQIKDMVTLRAFALGQTIMHSSCEYFVGNIIQTAKKLESYILGDATLPESYEDKTMNMYKDFMKEIAPKTQPSWIKPGDGLPCENKDILVMCKGSKFPMLGSHIGNGEFEAYDADVTKTTVDGEIEVVAWLPIPEYKA